jgi:hypothetical protein
MITNFENDSIKLMLMDGTTTERKQNEVWQFNMFKIDWGEVSKSLPYNYFEGKDCVADNPLMYQYEAIDLNNDQNDTLA